MKISFPEKKIAENIFDIMDDKSAGKIELNDEFIKEIFFSFSDYHLVLNIKIKDTELTKDKDIEIMEISINKGDLLIHKRSRVGILNEDKRHYLLPETFWDEFVSIVLPLKFVSIKESDFIIMKIKVFDNESNKVYESEELKFQMRLKGE